MDRWHTYRLVSYTHFLDSRGDERGALRTCLVSMAAVVNSDGGELGWQLERPLCWCMRYLMEPAPASHMIDRLAQAPWICNNESAEIIYGWDTRAE